MAWLDVARLVSAENARSWTRVERKDFGLDTMEEEVGAVDIKKRLFVVLQY